MKHSVLALACLLVTSGCASQEPQLGKRKQVGLPTAFLLGCWRSQAEQRRVTERWSFGGGHLLLGSSETVTQGRSVFFEYLRFEHLPGQVTYWAQPMGKAPVPFRMSEAKPNYLRLENPQHDYPQWIVYERQGTKLRATIGSLDEEKKPRRWNYEKIVCQ